MSDDRAAAVVWDLDERAVMFCLSVKTQANMQQGDLRMKYLVSLYVCNFIPSVS